MSETIDTSIETLCYIYQQVGH